MIREQPLSARKTLRNKCKMNTIIHKNRIQIRKTRCTLLTNSTRNNSGTKTTLPDTGNNSFPDATATSAFPNIGNNNDDNWCNN